jgi:hypothetical protein
VDIKELKEGGEERIDELKLKLDESERGKLMVF